MLHCDCIHSELLLHCCEHDVMHKNRMSVSQSRTEEKQKHVLFVGEHEEEYKNNSYHTFYFDFDRTMISSI